MGFQNWSLSRKLGAVLALLLIPLAALLYFLISEKDCSIAFTRQEIAGVAYLRALQQGLSAVVAGGGAAETRPWRSRRRKAPTGARLG